MAETEQKNPEIKVTEKPVPAVPIAERLKIAEKFRDAKNQMLKSEAFRVGVVVFFGLILLLFLLPVFFNNSALKFKIAQKISQVYVANFVINGDVKIALLPAPTIILEEAMLQNYQPKKFGTNPEKIYNFYAKKVRIKLPLFSSDSFASKIIFEDAILESYSFANQPKDRKNNFTQIADKIAKNSPAVEGRKLGSGISAKLFSLDGLDLMKPGTVDIPNIVVENGQMIIYDNLARIKEIKSINAQAEINKDEISAKGNFSSEDIISNFKLSAEFNSTASKPTSSLEIISPVMELRVSGNFTSENRGFFASDFNGKIDAEILELKSFYKSYISANNVLASKLKYSAKPLKISADIDSKAKEIAIKNFSVTSSLANGKGDIELSFAEKIPLIDVDLDLENLDLDSIWSSAPVAIDTALINQKNTQNPADEVSETLPQIVKTETPPPAAKDGVTPEVATTELVAKEPEKIAPINFEMTNKIKDFDLTAEIKIKNINYLEGEIKDANLYITVSQRGEILILPMIFRIPGEGMLRINGVLDNSTGSPKFVGKFDASGKVLKDIFKWLKIKSQNLKFDNLKEYSSYSDILLTPNTITLNNFYLNLNNGQSEFLGELKIDNSGKATSIISRFESNIFNIDDYFLTSGQNVYLSPGSLIQKLLWLNEISSNNDFAMRFDKLIYKGEEFPEQSLKLRFGRGYFEISDLNLKSQQTNLKANLSVDISDKNPKLEMSVVADNFHYETAQKSQLIVEDPSSKKIKKQNVFDQFFALPSLEGFNGKIMLDFADLKLDDFQVKNLKLIGILKDGSLNNSDITCSVYDGEFSYKGLLGLKQSKVINGNLTLNNAALQPLLLDMVGVGNVSGIVNVSASVTASTNKKDEFAKELTGEIKFSANAPSVEGYGLNDLVKKMFDMQTYRQELRDPEKILFNPASKTIFKQANGTIQINSGKEGKVRISATAPAVNGILSGSVNAATNSADILFNAIFLTGTRQKQTPINIATNLKGSMSALSQSTNLDQVKQYLGLLKGNPTPVPTPEQAPAEALPSQVPAQQPAAQPQSQPVTTP